MAQLTIEQWISVPDERRCPMCFRLDGLTFLAGQGPQPGIHPHCRCTRVTLRTIDTDTMSTYDRLTLGSALTRNLAHASRATTGPTGATRRATTAALAAVAALTKSASSEDIDRSTRRPKRHRRFPDPRAP